MNYSKLLIPTTRNIPRDATMVSHIMLLRGGYVRMLSRGIYSFLPLGLEVIKKISSIVREEMNRAGAQEILMPSVQPSEIWIESGRWESFGPELLKFKNREMNQYCIGPTHEEVVTDIARRELKSYRQLPCNLYQIQTKYRDEPRPRAGLLRCREFIMKDAYSFDTSVENAIESYKKMLVAYARIFARMGLDFKVVRAPTGSIGGNLSHEFQVITPAGEDTIVICEKCGYAVNIEIACSGTQKTNEESVAKNSDKIPFPEPVNTPNIKTVEEVAKFLSVPPSKIIKTIIVVYEDKAIAALVRGDRELNLLKLSETVGKKDIYLAGDAEIQRVTGAPVGFAGPVGLNIPVYADLEVKNIIDGVCGANKVDTHLMHVVPERDFVVCKWADIRKVAEGDPCPNCNNPLQTEKGIEGGQTFYLGTLYSSKMGAIFIDSDGVQKPFEMGCYGIGISRLMAAIVEQKNDRRGIIWPISVTPFQAIIIPVGDSDEIMKYSDQLTNQLEKEGLQIILDERDESPGVKFHDADLLGITIQIIVGRSFIKENKVEIRMRDGSQAQLVPFEEATNFVLKKVQNLMDDLENYALMWEKKILDVARIS